jgi:hypothetical protein
VVLNGRTKKSVDAATKRLAQQVPSIWPPRVAAFVKRVSETDILVNNLNANSLRFERTSKGVKVILSCLLSQIRRQKVTAYRKR